jgi:Zn-dependent protease with chaperone function
MTLAYLPRLFCVSMAAFFLVHSALGLAVALLSPGAVRAAQRMSSRSAARLLLTLRLLPAGFGLFAVAAFCIPSYCRLEPDAGAESVSFGFLAAALLGLAIWIVSLTRACSAAGRSLRYVRQCAGRNTRLAGPRCEIWLVEAPVPVLALARILRPRLLISKNVVNALSEDELGAVLDHERAHRASYDNAKRLALLLAPGLLPFYSGFGALDRNWARFAEWAADDRAVAGNPLRSVSLAAALVRVARLGLATPALMSSFADRRDLPARVDRLLRTAPRREPRAPRVAPLVAGAALAAALLAAALQPAATAPVYMLLERLVH